MIHRAYQHVTAAEELGKPRMRREAHVEVRAQRHQHDRPALVIAGGRQQLVEEPRPLVLAVATREQLLELVDGDHDPLTRSQSGQHHVDRFAAERVRELVAGVLAGP